MLTIYVASTDWLEISWYVMAIRIILLLTYSSSRARTELGVRTIHYSKGASIGGVICNNPCLNEKSSKLPFVISRQGHYNEW